MLFTVIMISALLHEIAGRNARYTLEFFKEIRVIIKARSYSNVIEVIVSVPYISLCHLYLIIIHVICEGHSEILFKQRCKISLVIRQHIGHRLKRDILQRRFLNIKHHGLYKLRRALVLLFVYRVSWLTDNIKEAKHIGYLAKLILLGTVTYHAARIFQQLFLYVLVYVQGIWIYSPTISKIVKNMLQKQAGHCLTPIYVNIYSMVDGAVVFIGNISAMRLKGIYKKDIVGVKIVLLTAHLKGNTAFIHHYYLNMLVKMIMATKTGIPNYRIPMGINALGKNENS